MANEPVKIYKSQSTQTSQKISYSPLSSRGKNTKNKTKKITKHKNRRKKSSKTPLKKQMNPIININETSKPASEGHSSDHSSRAVKLDSRITQCVNEIHVENTPSQHVDKPDESTPPVIKEITSDQSSFSSEPKAIKPKIRGSEADFHDNPSTQAFETKAESKLNFLNESLTDGTTCPQHTLKEASLCQIDTASENETVCGKKAVVQGRIFGKHLDCLIDTGSQVNAISRNEVPASILSHLGHTDLTIQSFSGNSPPILGTFATDVHIGSLTLYKCTFFVIDDTCRTIIGTPALKSNNVIVNLGKGEISNENGSCPFMYIEHKTIDLNYVEFQPSQPGKIPLALTSEESVLLKARSTRFVRLRSKYKVESAGTYAITDPFDENLPYGVILGKSVSTLSPKNQTCLVRICNTNDADISINKGARIATLHAVSIAEPHVLALQPTTTEEKTEKFNFNQIFVNISKETQDVK